MTNTTLMRGNIFDGAIGDLSLMGDFLDDVFSIDDGDIGATTIASTNTNFVATIDNFIPKFSEIKKTPDTMQEGGWILLLLFLPIVFWGCREAIKTSLALIKARARNQMLIARAEAKSEIDKDIQAKELVCYLQKQNDTLLKRVIQLENNLMDSSHR